MTDRLEFAEGDFLMSWSRRDNGTYWLHSERGGMPDCDDRLFLTKTQAEMLGVLLVGDGTIATGGSKPEQSCPGHWCGAKNDLDAKVCYRCGGRLEGGEK